MADCRKMVGGTTIAYQCMLKIPEGQTEHLGPCAAAERPATIAARARWEAEQKTNPTPVEVAVAAPAPAPLGLAEFQGEPKKFWDNRGDPTVGVEPVPAVKTEKEPDVTYPSLPQPVVPEVPTPPPAPPQAPSTAVPDQPTPVIPQEQQQQASVQALVIADIVEREQVGIDRYGTALFAFNGRDAGIDLYQELLDAVMYVRQGIQERNVIADLDQSAVARFVAQLLGGTPPAPPTPEAWGATIANHIWPIVVRAREEGQALGAQWDTGPAFLLYSCSKCETTISTPYDVCPVCRAPHDPVNDPWVEVTVVRTA